MRLVLDTNVLISAFISRGLCTQVLEHCAKHHELVTSPAIIAELRGKLLTKFHIPLAAVDEAVAALVAGMEVVDATTLTDRVSRDPDDDAVIATAVAGACSMIVTGDRDLLDLITHGDVSILAPRQFWELEARPEE